ncbi:hypothetical protein [Antribacter gilvus]|uniref:hypothetical protein n=1 Tax=Antribacter gilvus TaxID=2304675 RepID=UPI000F792EE5|nr:hypothetical protein [Antribacter gilvus]
MDHTTTTTPGGSRRLVLTLAVAVALLCTGVAYEGMYGFGRDMLDWDLGVALAFAGIFELAQLTVALLAREAIKDGRPAGTLLTITWMLAAASGLLAAWHELAAGHGLGAALFRIAAPVLAAGLWHLVLLGDQHLATGRTWSQIRQTARMHALFLTVEDAARAYAAGTDTPAARRAIARAEAKRRRARAIALKTVPPHEVAAEVSAWLQSLSAVGDAVADVARMHIETNNRVAGIAHTPALSALSGTEYEDRAAEAVRAELADMARTDSTREPVSAVSAAGQDRPRVRTAVRRTVRPAGPATGDRSARLAVVSALLSERPDADSADALAALTAAGHEVTDRTARRDLETVRAAHVEEVNA